MGNILVCCSRSNSLNKYSKKFIQAINKDKKIHIQVYDIEYEREFTYEQNFRIITQLDGFSQLSTNNCLYLCGNSVFDEDMVNSHEGSYLFKLDFTKNTYNNGGNLSFLINSFHYHYNPSMIKYGEYIVVVGGKSSVKCEVFNTNNEKWKPLPDLPHERLGCSLYSDENVDSLFLFGGFCSKQNKYMETILKLNMSELRSQEWEVIVIKQNSEYLARSYSACAKISPGFISILGGKNALNSKTSSIIDYDIIKKKVVENTKKLEMSSVFLMSSYIDLNNKDFFFMDEECFVHKISRGDFDVNGSMANSFIFNTFTTEN